MLSPCQIIDLELVRAHPWGCGAEIIKALRDAGWDIAPVENTAAIDRHLGVSTD